MTNNSFLHKLPGAGGLVCFGGEPASVPDLLIAAISRKVDGINHSAAASLKSFSTGDSVLIKGGPFAGQEAIFENCKNGNDRVQVLIQFLRDRQIPMELPAVQIEPKKQAA